MALADSGAQHWPEQPGLAPSFVNLTLNAADQVAGFVFRVWKAGIVTRGHFRAAAVTAGCTADARLETVNNGLPTGTLFGANTNVAQVIAAANSWYQTNPFTAPATVAVGDLLFFGVVNPTVGFGNFNLSGGTNTALYPTVSPYSINPTRAGKNVAVPICALEYDDGSLITPLGCWPMHAISSVAANTGTNPDELAAYLTVPAPARVIGWSGQVGCAAGADFRVSLYANGNDTPILTTDYDGDIASGTGAGGNERPFNSTLEILPGIYRLAVLPLTANTVTVRYFEVPALYPTLLDNFSGRSACHYSARNRSGISDPDAAVWSQTANRRLQLALVTDRIEAGGGGANRSLLPAGLSAMG